MRSLNMARKPSLERPQMILVAMFELSGGTTKALKYEDIVVRAFQRFPQEFALRGYSQYPDSSDIHKPLYGPLKRAGFVRSGNKTFALTPHGVEEAKRLSGKSAAAGPADRISRDMEAELDRMLASEAFQLYVAATPDRILDTDFYSFLGCTVRTSRNDFLGRLQVCQEAIEQAATHKYPDLGSAKHLAAAWNAMRQKFADLIKRRENAR